MKAVGIDLAGVKSHPTGLCLMDSGLHASTWPPAERIAAMSF